MTLGLYASSSELYEMNITLAGLQELENSTQEVVSSVNQSNKGADRS